MSEVAKDRLLAVGARFSSYEQENATSQQVGNNIPNVTKGNSHPTTEPPQAKKMPFWKKNLGKVPGR